MSLCSKILCSTICACARSGSAESTSPHLPDLVHTPDRKINRNQLLQNFIHKKLRFFRPYNFNPKNNICYALNIYDIFINYKSYVSSVHFIEGLSIDKVKKFSLDLSFDDNALKSFLMHSKFEITTWSPCKTSHHYWIFMNKTDSGSDPRKIIRIRLYFLLNIYEIQ